MSSALVLALLVVSDYFLNPRGAESCENWCGLILGDILRALGSWRGLRVARWLVKGLRIPAEGRLVRGLPQGRSWARRRNTSDQPSKRSGTAAQRKGKLQHAGESRRATQEKRAGRAVSPHGLRPLVLAPRHYEKRTSHTRASQLTPPEIGPLQYGSSSISGASKNATGHSSPTLSDATGSRFSDRP